MNDSQNSNDLGTTMKLIGNFSENCRSKLECPCFPSAEFLIPSA